LIDVTGSTLEIHAQRCEVEEGIMIKKMSEEGIINELKIAIKF